MNLKEIIVKHKFKIILAIILLFLIIFLYPERSAYNHAAIWGSLGGIDCPCIGYEYSAHPAFDSPSWKKCIGYVPNDKCTCKLFPNRFENGSCDINQVIIRINSTVSK